MRALKWGDGVLKLTQNDNAPGDKAAMLHQLLKLTNRLMAPFSTHLSHRYKISLNEFRLLMTIGALGRTASHELAELTGVNVMSVSRAVATLEKNDVLTVERRAFDVQLGARERCVCTERRVERASFDHGHARIVPSWVLDEHDALACGR